MDKEKITWRTTADDGSIAEKWNSPGTPVYYVLDPQGVPGHLLRHSESLDHVDGVVGLGLFVHHG